MTQEHMADTAENNFLIANLNENEHKQTKNANIFKGNSKTHR